MHNNYSDHSNFEKRETLINAINRAHALVDIASTLDFSILEQEILVEYFNLTTEIMRKIKNIAHELYEEKTIN